MRRTFLTLCLVGVLAAGCGADEVPVATDGAGGTGTTPATTVPLDPIAEGAAGLPDARQRWAGAGIDDYTMTYREVCFCPEATVTVTVADGQVTDTAVETDIETGQRVDGQSVDNLFDEIQSAVDNDANEIRASYDTDTGRPIEYWIDVSDMMADEEHGIEVLELVPAGASADPSPEATGPTELPDGPDVVTTGTSQPPSVRQVMEAELTEPWGCGYGFHVTDPAHTVALQLRTTAPPPIGPSTVTLPDPSWTGEVDLGIDLLRVACADLDLARPVEPDETWPVVGGTIVIDAPGVGGCGSPTTATATVTNLSVVASDGSTITFPSLTLINDEWGCFAG